MLAKIIIFHEHFSKSRFLLCYFHEKFPEFRFLLCQLKIVILHGNFHCDQIIILIRFVNEGKIVLKGTEIVGVKI